jgi:hypothetical protein
LTDIAQVSAKVVLGNITGITADVTEVSILDEDDLTSNSDTALATQQSIKAYVDQEVSAGGGGGITEGTSQATTSGTAKDFTSLPSGTKRIVITFDSVSTDGTDDIMVQIGDSGGIETTGYSSTSGRNNGSTVGADNSTTGFNLGTFSAANIHVGHMILTRLNSSSFTWLASHSVRYANSGVLNGAGVKTLTAELDRLRITTTSGTDTFDAGNVNITYE